MKQAGFTLIELLVTATIIVVLSGASVATYLDYRDRNAVSNDASAVAERLRTVQIKATATEVPAPCVNGVTSYVVSYGVTSLTVTATCPGIGNQAVGSLALTLTSSVFRAAGSVTFDSRSVSASPTPLTINICGNKKLYLVVVSTSGNVGKPVYGGSC